MRMLQLGRGLFEGRVAVLAGATGPACSSGRPRRDVRAVRGTPRGRRSHRLMTSSKRWSPRLARGAWSAGRRCRCHELAHHPHRVRMQRLGPAARRSPRLDGARRPLVASGPRPSVTERCCPCTGTARGPGRSGAGCSAGPAPARDAAPRPYAVSCSPSGPGSPGSSCHARRRSSAAPPPAPLGGACPGGTTRGSGGSSTSPHSSRTCGRCARVAPAAATATGGPSPAGTPAARESPMPPPLEEYINFN